MPIGRGGNKRKPAGQLKDKGSVYRLRNLGLTHWIFLLGREAMPVGKLGIAERALHEDDVEPAVEFEADVLEGAGGFKS